MAEIPADAFGPDGITDADRAAIAEDNLSAALMQRDEAYAAGVAAGEARGRTAAAAAIRADMVNRRVGEYLMGMSAAARIAEGEDRG